MSPHCRFLQRGDIAFIHWHLSCYVIGKHPGPPCRARLAAAARSRAPRPVRMKYRRPGYGEFVARTATAIRAANCEFVPLP